MQTFEIDLFDFLRKVYQKKSIIVIIALSVMMITFSFNWFMVEKTYRTEMWIRLNKNFLGGEEVISLEYIKSYFFYPEVLNSVTDNVRNAEELKRRLTFREVDGLIQMELNHPNDENASKNLKKWVISADMKLIQDEGRSLLLALEEDISFVRTQYDIEVKRLKEIETLLLKEEQYNNDVAPNTSSQILVLKEERPSFTELAIQRNTTKISIVALQTKAKFMEDLFSEYQILLKNVQETILNPQRDLSLLFSELEDIRIKYNSYLHQQTENEDDKAVELSFQPFRIVSEPHTDPTPINQNILLKTLLMGLLTCFAGIFVILFMEYFQGHTKEGTHQAVVERSS